MSDSEAEGPGDGPHIDVGRVCVDFTLNGERRSAEFATSAVLLNTLRQDFGMSGVRGSCERGVCGACTVLLDGRPVASCSVFTFEVDEARVETIEGQLNGDDELSPIQQAFAERGGFQCGYCTPGMIMLATALLRVGRKPDREEIRRWIGSNICRCTGYEMILDSVEYAAELLEEARIAAAAASQANEASDEPAGTGEEEQ